MTDLLTAAQMRAIETAAIESGQVTGLELMERAGRGVVEAVFEEWPDLRATSHKAVVLCGPGNNGGDGFVVARLLKEWGWVVDVFLYGDADKLPPDAFKNFQRWRKIGGQVSTDWAALWQSDAPDLLIDAVFGTGLKRPLDKQLANHLNVRMRHNWGAWTQVKYVAVDCPSGLDCDSGHMRAFLAAAQGDEDYEPVNWAQLTVTFHSPKRGHYLHEGPSVCSKLRVVDIGIWPWDQESAIPGLGGSGSRTVLLEPVYMGKPLRGGPFLSGMLEKHTSDHKYGHGHALVLSGGAGRTGAARLAARGALRIGAGLVTLGVPGSAQIEVASQIAALMLRRVDDAGQLSEVLQDRRLNALCLGPGLGIERARNLVPVALGQGGQTGHPTRGVVLDADALTAFAGDSDTFFGMLNGNCVLTPHAGEFARLFPDIAERLNDTPTSGPAYSKVDATRDAAARAGCVVLFKGPDTVIAAPDGRCSVNAAVYDRAAPWLATAGSGDVLAGFITGLLARGFAPMLAAETAAWLHVECARNFGPGLIAEDLPEQLPVVFRALWA